MPLKILHADEHLVAIDKPTGLLVHRSHYARDVRDGFAIQKLRDQIGRYVYPVHRLDRPTSGVLLFALDKETLASASAAFQARTVQKTYLAVVRGHAPDCTVSRMLKDAEGREQAAETRFKTLATAARPWPIGRFDGARFSLVEARPKSGRKHQIRRHLAGIGHPILGDVGHGDRHHNKLVRERIGLDRLMLHALRLEMAHPVTGEALCIEATVSARWSALLDGLGVGCGIVPPTR